MSDLYRQYILAQNRLLLPANISPTNQSTAASKKGTIWNPAYELEKVEKSSDEELSVDDLDIKDHPLRMRGCQEIQNGGACSPDEHPTGSYGCTACSKKFSTAHGLEVNIHQ